MYISPIFISYDATLHSYIQAHITTLCTYIDEEVKRQGYLISFGLNKETALLSSCLHGPFKSSLSFSGLSCN